MLAECDAAKIEYKKTWSIDYLMELLPPDAIDRLKNKIPKKIGFYEVLAERLSLDTSDVDDPLGRGHELEQEAILSFSEATGHKVETDTGVWVSDDSEYITLSPDGEIDDEHAVEVKCLNSARHLQALIEDRIPSDYDEQILQYFIVNEKLEQLFFVFYDPRIAAKPLFWKTIERTEVADRAQEVLEQEKRLLAEIDALVTELTF